VILEITKALLGFIPGLVSLALKWPALASITLGLGTMLLVAWFHWARLYRRNRNLKELQKDVLADVRSAVEQFIPSRVQVERIDILYYIGLCARSDWQERRYVFAVEPGGRPILGKELDFAYSGTRVPGELDFDALGLQEYFEGGEVLWLPLNNVESARVKVCAWFHPAIREGEERKLSMRARTKGVWNDLRARGFDKICSYRLSDEAQELNIILIPPKGVPAEKLKLRPGPSHTDEGTVKIVSVEGGLRGVCWNLDNPDCGEEYSYRVQCPAIRGLQRRVAVAVRRTTRTVTDFVKGA